MPDGRGGSTLYATAGSLAQAMERFRNIAQGLCPQGSYDFGEAIVGPPCGHVAFPSSPQGVAGL